MFDDLKTAFDFFNSLPNPAVAASIKETWRVTEPFLRLLEADKEAVPDAFAAFKTAYWDLQISWVEAVLRARDDFDRAMLNAVKARAAQMDVVRGPETIMSKWQGSSPHIPSSTHPVWFAAPAGTGRRKKAVSGMRVHHHHCHYSDRRSMERWRLDVGLPSHWRWRAQTEKKRVGKSCITRRNREVDLARDEDRRWAAETVTGRK
ncbi:hypothetical protein VTH06DRAFT_1840 [Thermothelomyces fergusii]